MQNLAHKGPLDVHLQRGVNDSNLTYLVPWSTSCNQSIDFCNENKINKLKRMLAMNVIERGHCLGGNDVERQQRQFTPFHCSPTWAKAFSRRFPQSHSFNFSHNNRLISDMRGLTAISLTCFTALASAYRVTSPGGGQGCTYIPFL
jgi:hypothetical protein